MSDFNCSKLVEPKACTCYLDAYLWGHIISGRPWTWFAVIEMFLIVWSCTFAEMAFKVMENEE